MKSLKINFNDVGSKRTDEFLALMFGVEDALERTILRYIYKSGNKYSSASYHQIMYYIVIKNNYCSSDRLRKRLESLVKFNYLIKEEYKGIIIYSSNMDNLKTKNEESF